MRPLMTGISWNHVPGGLLALFLATSCDSMASSNPGLLDASAAPEAGSGGAVPSDDSGRDASSGSPHPDANPGVDFDATTLDAPGPDPALVSCGADAAEAGTCRIPYSVCANGRWLVFYDNPQCVADSCTWDKRYVDCGSIGCSSGGCQAGPTM